MLTDHLQATPSSVTGLLLVAGFVVWPRRIRNFGALSGRTTWLYLYEHSALQWVWVRVSPGGVEAVDEVPSHVRTPRAAVLFLAERAAELAEASQPSQVIAAAGSPLPAQEKQIAELARQLAERHGIPVPSCTDSQPLMQEVCRMLAAGPRPALPSVYAESECRMLLSRLQTGIGDNQLDLADDEVLPVRAFLLVALARPFQDGLFEMLLTAAGPGGLDAVVARMEQDLVAYLIVAVERARWQVANPSVPLRYTVRDFLEQMLPPSTIRELLAWVQ